MGRAVVSTQDTASFEGAYTREPVLADLLAVAPPPVQPALVLRAPLVMRWGRKAGTDDGVLVTDTHFGWSLEGERHDVAWICVTNMEIDGDEVSISYVEGDVAANVRLPLTGPLSYLVLDEAGCRWRDIRNRAAIAVVPQQRAELNAAPARPRPAPHPRFLTLRCDPVLPGRSVAVCGIWSSS